MGILDTIKKVAEQTSQAGAPAAFMFGIVTSASPLVMRIDNRFDISEKQIVIMKQFMDGLAVGDKVVLLRNQGGQEFLILGRL